MQVVIRADASLQIGTGHVMRCLTLADGLKKQGAKVHFICRAHPGNLIEMIESKGYAVVILDASQATRPGHFKPEANLFHADWLGGSQKQDALECQPFLQGIRPDWLIVDHYAIDQVWQVALTGLYTKLMVIDDLADRQHQCDLLLDQTYGRQGKDYRNLVPEYCQMRLGSQYALLRPEFIKWREYSLNRRRQPQLKNVLITMGGVDSGNVTGQVLHELAECKLPKSLEITVVMGETAPHISAVKAQAAAMPYNTQVKVDINNIAEIMANADLAIGAAGATTWERCCLGVPTIQKVVALNQQFSSETLDRSGIVRAWDKNLRLQDLIDTLDFYGLSRRSSDVCDGKGASKVVGEMMNKVNFRKMNDSDLDTVREWREREEVKKFMYTRHAITKDEHQCWWESIRDRCDILQMIVELDSIPIGVVSFSQIDLINSNAVWAFYLGPNSPRGIGSLIEFYAIKYAFEVLNLHKLKCEVLGINQSVIKLHKKFGFIEEGIFREEHLYDNVFIDVYRLGLLQNDWLSISETLENRMLKIWKF
ncbi:UDP-2,4-diacetamido-2,4,6-trideoxy-beta-L-altropyranose hydrolase [Thiomicrorhabdus arctica]|uniref:UDP-2,4-diacetamido-2,4, 6-trideoxy-beta-L-altropyranose hydrolase n=1 Tax=Thiomicrorhabdus arctica TaxID=131540 RepID=UPI00039B75CD|nr:UDP-2,4-diacetamido-2,4,6-trideoxy-beta-L-altropyranose hydrolase [Thiomicrorhabdus arctica]